MEKDKLTDDKPLKTWISLTGYRTLLILKALIESGKTIDEMVKIVKNEPDTGKASSKDTLRVTINTLKAAGCEILRPNISNGYRYMLAKHPFVLNISEEEINVLIMLRNKIAENLNWPDILTLNDLYEKIASLTGDSEVIDNIINSAPFAEVDKQILIDISNPSLINKKVSIIYNSPKFDEEEIDIVPQKITAQNGKLYLWCFNCKYEKNGLLMVDRIKKINKVSINNYECLNPNVYEVVYELWGLNAKNFEIKENEEIISKDEEKIRVLAHVDNEFLFIQRLLLFGAYFKVISPDFFREKLIDKIKAIRKEYENE